jgi:putative endonuclease
MDSTPIITTKELGNKAERMAAEFLGRLGFEVIQRNYRVGKSEIDIIVRNKELVVFVEVKSRSNLKYGEPEGTISEAQMARIERAASFWQHENGYEGQIRFDIVAVSWKNNKPQIRHFQDFS